MSELSQSTDTASTIDTENLEYSIDVDTKMEDITKYIEKTIENKFNVLKDSIEIKQKERTKPHELTVHELYQNTLQYLIDVIKDISFHLSFNYKNYPNQEYRKILFKIFFSKERILYTGIILIFISFIMYFIDNVSI